MCVTNTDSSAASASTTPPTVTVRARSQFCRVNVNDAGNGADTAPVSPELNATVTTPVGRDAKRTV